AARRQPFGRRTADARPGPRGGQPAAPAAGGRAVARPLACHGGGGVPGAAAIPGRRHDHIARRAERPARARLRRPGIRPAPGRDRDGRRGRRALVGARHAQALSWIVMTTEREVEMRSRGLCTALAAVCVAVLAMAAPATAAEKPPIKLGAILPMTGFLAAYGEIFHIGMQMGVDDVNAAGGVNGSKIELQVEDDQLNPQQSVLLYRKLV